MDCILIRSALIELCAIRLPAKGWLEYFLWMENLMVYVSIYIMLGMNFSLFMNNFFNSFISSLWMFLDLIFCCLILLYFERKPEQQNGRTERLKL